jgi:putative glycosyltransferase (TIGR04372 family)
MTQRTVSPINTATTLPQVTVVSGPDLISSMPFLVKFRGLPFKIFAAMLDRTLGDFLCRGYFAAAVKLNFGPSQLTAYYRDDRPYKKDIVAINPYIDRTIKVSGDSYLPLEAFYDPFDRHLIPGTEKFIQSGHARPDLVLVPSMMLLEDLPRFQHLPVFALPETQRPKFEDRLVQLGLDPARWYCCIFYRQPNYKFRGATAYRDVGDRPFEALVNWIIDELGGQVVRIGHPQMRRFAARMGFIDLSVVEDEFMLHAAAASRARFMVVTPSGPAMLPGVFKVPFAMTNAVSILGAWDPDHLLLPRHVFRPDGRRIDIRMLLKRSKWHDAMISEFVRNRGFKLADNTFEELREVTRMLFERTTEHTGWRPPPQPIYVKSSGRYVLPEPYRRPLTIVEFPELAPKTPPT